MQKCQVFAGSIFFNVRIWCFSLSYMIVNWLIVKDIWRLLNTTSLQLCVFLPDCSWNTLSLGYSSPVFSLFDQKKAKGEELFDQIMYHLDIVEKDYFGLRFMDSAQVPVSMALHFTVYSQ